MTLLISVVLRSAFVFSFRYQLLVKVCHSVDTDPAFGVKDVGIRAQFCINHPSEERGDASWLDGVKGSSPPKCVNRETIN